MIIKDVIEIAITRSGNVTVFMLTLSTALQVTIPGNMWIEVIDLHTIKVYT